MITGDDVFWTRFLLSESKAVTQSFNVGFRVPTGDTDIGNGVAAIIPQYEFWTNYWQGLVVRAHIAAARRPGADDAHQREQGAAQ